MASRRAIRPEDSQLERISTYPNQIALLEEQMKHGTDADVTNSRMKLCELHSDWILEDPEAASAGDSVNRLWKKCFYERIALARKMISKNKKKGNDLMESKYFLATFLKEGVTLMGYLIDRLKNRMIKANTANEGNSARDGGVQCLSRLYICLGDLYRYDEKLDKAASSYHMASNLAPGMSHCFNQLAVVSDCKESTAVATYWYIRAIHSEDRVAKAETNLRLLLNNNRNWLTTQDRAQATPILASAATKLFVSKFVDLYYAGVLQENIDAKSLLNCVNSFQTLLASSAFSDSLLCKLIAILAANDTYMYDFGLCLMERVIVMLEKKATRRTLVPALLLMEYVLIKPDTTKKEFWKTAVTVWNSVALQEVESEEETTLKEYTGLKGFKPFEPFLGEIPGYFLSDVEACAQFDKSQTESETASARILRFRTLKPALLLLDDIVEGPNGSLLYQDPAHRNDYGLDGQLDGIENESDLADDNMEYDEGEDIVLAVPMPVQPASKRQAVSSSPMRVEPTAPATPLGVVAPMSYLPQNSTFPLLSGHVAPFQAQDKESAPTFCEEASPQSSTTIGPPPGFTGVPLFGRTASEPVEPASNSLFQLNTATANPFAFGDFIPPPRGSQQGCSSIHQENSSNLTTSNPFAM